MAPQQQTPDLTGKVFFITGGTAGLGKESILSFAKGGAQHVYFTGRNETAASTLMDELRTKHSFSNATFLKGDISSLQSVNHLADEFLALQPTHLNVLMCNAGIMATSPALSTDGYETQFATNHLGHALLIRRLLPLLQRTTSTGTTNARIINLSSIAHNLHPKSGIAFPTLRTKQEDLGTAAGASWARYGQSKLANMLYADELSRRYPDLISVSVHPGIVETELVTKHISSARRLGMRIANLGRKTSSVEEGARNQVWAATATATATVEGKRVRSGVYYVPVGIEGKRERMGNDVELAGRLWEWTRGELDAFEARVG